MTKPSSGVANGTTSGTSNELQAQIDEQRKGIHTDGFSMSIGEIQNLYTDLELDLHPEFQRFFRWSVQSKTRWIESILLGVPLPSVFVSQRPDGTWDVLDGLERLSTILEFMGLLRDEEGDPAPPLVLEGARCLSALDKKKWHDSRDPENSLTPDQRRSIRRAKIDVKILLLQGSESAHHDLFERVNSAGSGLSPRDLRNCLLVGVDRGLFGWLENLAKHEPFQRCAALPDELVKEGYDVELVLRFILLRRLPVEELSAAGASLGEFLTNKVLETAGVTRFDRNEEEAAFKATFDLLGSALDSDGFRRFEKAGQRFTGGFSAAAYDVVALGIGWNPEEFAKSHTPEQVAEIVKRTVWSDARFPAETDPSDARRFAIALERGRTIFGR